MADTPTPRAMMNGTVMGPVVTPPESKATLKKSFGRKGRQDKYHGVADHQERRKGHGKQHTQEGDHQKGPNPAGHRQDQRHIGHRRHLARQHLEIRL